MLTADHDAWGHASSTGLGFTHEQIVDAHFEACRPHYLAVLAEVGIAPGWHVLDAGCGSGAFLAPLCDLVGATGRVSGIELAAENAASASRRVDRDRPGRDVRVQRGDVLSLPYADRTFDAVWLANTAQYLDDDELRRALRELRRVLRPGGVLAVKELDASLITVRPGDPFQFTDFFRHAARDGGYARQLLRARDLYGALEDAGLVSVRQRTFLMEHRAPMTEEVLRFYAAACARVARQAIDLGVAGEWLPFLDPQASENPLRARRAYLSEGNTLATGVVPPAPGGER
ncbi:class I SAM-dependent methyltransferase [Streptomyces sulphureus]|uniref:class I SAM-dependent methyltransferase n=1 Tax=Streptomyces sulphureus TaxID=47758 RepID=UPI0003651B02|nr:class I SAM-dependent methyltransferase [Streptomyces sulphureus]